MNNALCSGISDSLIPSLRVSNNRHLQRRGYKSFMHLPVGKRTLAFTEILPCPPINNQLGRPYGSSPEYKPPCGHDRSISFTGTLQVAGRFLMPMNVRRIGQALNRPLGTCRRPCGRYVVQNLRISPLRDEAIIC